MSWASKKRSKFIIGFFIIVATLIIIPAAVSIYEPATCFDGKQNGGETGVDCGGSCARVCNFERIVPTVLWSRIFEIDDGVHSAIALVENPNFDVEAFDVPYVFTIRDEENLLVAERRGRAYIPPKETFPIFETGIDTGNRKPQRVFFEFEEVPDWQKGSAQDFGLSVIRQEFSNEGSKPRLDAVVVNESDREYSDVEVVAILSDVSGNAVGVSRTAVDFLDRRSSVPIVFTWPNPFAGNVATIELYPRVVQK